MSKVAHRLTRLAFVLLYVMFADRCAPTRLTLVPKVAMFTHRTTTARLACSSAFIMFADCAAAALLTLVLIPIMLTFVPLAFELVPRATRCACLKFAALSIQILFRQSPALTGIAHLMFNFCHGY
jgi:hypothetical protein